MSATKKTPQAHANGKAARPAPPRRPAGRRAGRDTRQSTGGETTADDLSFDEAADTVYRAMFPELYGDRKPEKVELVPLSDGAVFEVAVDAIKPAVINDVVYGVIDPDDKSLDELARQMNGPEGQLEPVVLSKDHVLMSGHRRRAVARRLGWRTLKARYHEPPVRSTDPQFEKLLVMYNTQRDKSPDVRVREQMVLTDPDDAYQNLVSERAERARVKADTLTLGAGRRRKRISAAKRPFLDAIKRVIAELEDYWPLSDRRVFYALLNDPPLIHAKKPGSRFRNNRESYRAVCDVLTQARLAGEIPFDAIGDETRPVATWDVHANVGPFIRGQVDDFCTGYWRDLMQGQPNHVEIVGEKLTVEGIVRPVASKYCLPYTIGRGYSSLPPRKAMFDRYEASHKDWLVILFLGDHDPEGWDIAETFSKSMRDDFGVTKVKAVKVALKPGQVRQLGLPPNADAKTTSSRFKKFAARFGPAAYELEAPPPDLLRRWLDEAVRSVIDVDAFNAQVEKEKQDAATVAGFKKASVDYLKGLRFEES
jgi:hypothetical protein